MADYVVEEVEWSGLPIDDQLLDHLATPEGCFAVWKDGLLPECVEDDNVRDALKFVLDYMDEHREPPHISTFALESGYDEFNKPIAPIAYVINKLRDNYRRVELRKVVTKIGRLSGTPEEAVAYGLSQLGAIQAATSGKGGDLSSDDMEAVLDRYMERLEDQSAGVSFGYKEIDDHLGGLRLGEIAVIAARPKRYKSWQHIVSANAAWEQGETPCIQTMEMSSMNMLERWVCMRAGVSWSKFEHGNLSRDDLNAIEEAMELVHSYDNKIHFLRPLPGQRNVPYLVNSAQEVGATVMYIDQLSWFDDAKSDDAWRKIGKIMEQLKDAAQFFPILMAAQFNREAVNLTGIADSSKIGLSDMVPQTADLLLGIYASKEMLEEGLIHYGVVDSRNFEPAGWEVKVNLSKDSSFKVLEKLNLEYDQG